MEMQVNPGFRNLERVKVGDRRWTHVGGEEPL